MAGETRRLSPPGEPDVRTLLAILAELELRGGLVRESDLLRGLRPLGSPARRRRLLRWSIVELLVLSETRTAIDRATGRTFPVEVYRLNRANPRVAALLGDEW